VPKEAAATLIVDAIRTVISGRRFLTPGVVDLMARSLEETEGQLFDEELSPRELSVLVLLAEGKSVRDIARRLTITMNTVYTYRRRLLGKLGLHSNVELTRYAIQRKLVS
jgi:DNA-binding NarL/FixJ family response regulator